MHYAIFKEGTIWGYLFGLRTPSTCEHYFLPSMQGFSKSGFIWGYFRSKSSRLQCCALMA
jgi:hypothetical protein